MQLGFWRSNLGLNSKFSGDVNQLTIDQPGSVVSYNDRRRVELHVKKGTRPSEDWIMQVQVIVTCLFELFVSVVRLWGQMGRGLISGKRNG